MSAKTTQEKVKTYQGLTGMDCTRCIAVPGTDYIIDMIHPDTELTIVYGKTLAQVRAEKGEYAGAVIMDFDEFMRQKAARQHTPITWERSTAEKYDEMLECLPPASMYGGGFLVGEPWDHDAETGEPRYQGFRHSGDGYYVATRPMTVREFRAVVVA